MKKVLVNIISILSLIVVIVSSCTKENQEQNGNILGSRKITATFDDNTKTALGSGNKPKWSVGDEIWVSDGSNSTSITLTESDIDIETATTFEITLPESIKGSTIYAVYPAAVASGITEGKISISIPQLQTGTFAEANICVAETNGNNLKFKNATSIIKVSDFQGYITSVEFNIEKGAGNYFITYGDELAINAGTTSNKITLSPNNPGPYYIAVAPVTIKENSEFNYKNDTFNSYVGKYVVTTEKKLKNNTIYNIGSFKANKLPGVFTVSAEGKKIQFSTGYLQAIYNASTDSYNWQNASDQWEVVSHTKKDGNISVNSQKDGKIVDCFASITSVNCNGLGLSKASTVSKDWGELFTDDTWSSLKRDEWNYLINISKRCAIAKLVGIGDRNGDGKESEEDEIGGVLIFPDNFESPAGIIINTSDTQGAFAKNTFTLSDFKELEKNGAVFLAKGDCTSPNRNKYDFNGVFVKIYDWGSEYIHKAEGERLVIKGGSGIYGMAVRLTTVYNAPSSSSVSANTIDLGLNEIDNEWN